MPFGGLLSLAGPALGIGGALGGLFGGSPASKVQPYQYANRAGADNQAYGDIGGLSNFNLGAQYLPEYQQYVQQALNNPYAGGYQSGANAAGGYGVASGMNAFNTGGALSGAALSTFPDVNALLSLGFDPQNALYSKLQQQNTDATNAGLSARGLGMSPYAAGVANQSNQDFNMNWENNQLQRAVAGASGAQGLLSNAAGVANTGAGLQAGAAGQIAGGAGLPYSTFNGINANALQTLSGAGSYGTAAAQLPQQQIGDLLQYLAQSTSQQNSNTNQANSSFYQNQILGNQLGQGLAGLNKATSGWNTNANPFYYSPSSSFSWG